MIHEKIAFRRSILAKLFGISVVILLSVAGMIAVSLLMFTQTKKMLRTTISAQVNDVVANSSLTRELHSVFHEATLMFSLFLEHEDMLDTTGDQMMTRLRKAIVSAEAQAAAPLLDGLRQFEQDAQAERERCRDILRIAHQIRALDASISANLTELENLVTDTMIDLSSGGDPEVRIIAEQLTTTLPDYQRILLQLRILVSSLLRENLSAQAAEHRYDQEILDLLDEFREELLIAANGGKTFERLGKTLHDAITPYQEAIAKLRDVIAAYQQQLISLQRTQTGITSTVETLERELSQTTQGIQQQIDHAIDSSTLLLVIFSAAAFIILLVAGNYAINIIRPIPRLARIAMQIADGDMTVNIPSGGADEIGLLRTAMRYMAETTQRVQREIERLSQAVQQGQLATRGDLQAFSGDWRKLVEGVNKIIAAFLTPIEQTTAYLDDIARGEIPDEMTAECQGDFNATKTHLNLLIRSMREVTTLAHQIAEGQMMLTIRPRSDHDEFLTALKKMVDYLQHIANITERIANNELEVNVTPLSKEDALNHSLRRMVTNLRAMMSENAQALDEVRQQNWMRSGQAELGHVMSGEQSPVALAKHVVSFLAQYLKVQIGALYLAEEQQKDTVLQLAGTYAYFRRKGVRNSFKLGESLVGQAALERECIEYANIPDEYLQIGSGLGEATPHYILVMPFMHENELKGVIEFGSAQEFSERQKAFLTQAAGNIAVAFHSVQNRLKVQTLLEATQRQAEELQRQQEQLRVANEELEAQTDALRHSEQQLQQQQEELRQTNEELEEQTKALERQQAQLQEKNQTLREAQLVIEQKARDLEISSKYKSEFLANMSHELRTPLNSLLILASLLKENKDGNLTEKQVEFAAMIHRSGAELLELINDVLDLSKVEAGRMDVNLDEMSLQGLAAYVQQHFGHVAEAKGLSLTITLEDGLPECIVSDRQRVEQIVKNFLSNAFKFTEQGGVTARIFRPKDQAALPHGRLIPSQSIAIAISDTGIGIPADKQQVIFEAFQQVDGTTSRKYGGTGLGLSISREFTKLLGGEIHLESETGKGSAFTLLLPERFGETPPAAAQPLADIAPKPATEEPTLLIAPTKSVERIRDDRNDCAPGDKSMLIIEHDLPFAKILFDLARGRGFKCLIAGDGAAGLQLAYQFLPSAITLDLNLPEMDGQTILHKLQANPNTRKIPVHIISAADLPRDARPVNVVGHLKKPLTPQALEQVFTTIEPHLAAQTKRLLIVEDDPIARATLTELLQGIGGVEITAADSGEQAYTLLETTVFDGLVLDLGLRDMSGFDLLDAIKADSAISPPPIIVYTGKDLTKEEERRLQSHTASTIIKGGKSSERLLDEVTLFLRHVESKLPEQQQPKPRLLHDKDAVFHGKQVLIVDDDMRNVYALANVLDDKGMAVLIAENGKDALEQLRTNGDSIDLVLMDIMMPEMDGYEAIRLIREQPPFRRLPIIALTAKAMKGDRQKCLESGANDYLSKPIEIDKLLSLLRVWLY